MPLPIPSAIDVAQRFRAFRRTAANAHRAERGGTLEDEFMAAPGIGRPATARLERRERKARP